MDKIVLHLASLGETQESTIAQTLVEGLRDALRDRVTLVDAGSTTIAQLRRQHPDLIHIIGLGGLATRQLMARAGKLRIPYVVTPLSTLQPWTHVRHPHFPPTTILVASSHIEHEQLAKLYPQNPLRHIANPVVTADTSFDEYARHMQEVYTEALRIHDAAVCDDIARHISKLGEEDVAISDILQQVLYIRYQHHRRHITQSSLDRLATTMITTNYDEALMADRLNELQLTTFFAQLETFLAEHSTLTEGFMPIPSQPNKTFTLS
ncbi:MAG: hypothetical protein IKX44_04050 [Prevotella sp.]|nr:hypothetical protein [Prevotella sp.]